MNNKKIILIIIASILAVLLLVAVGILILNDTDVQDNSNPSSTDDSTDISTDVTQNNSNEETSSEGGETPKTKYSDLTVDWFKENGIYPDVYADKNIYTGSCDEFPFIDGHGVYNLLVTTDEKYGFERINTLMYGHAIMAEGDAFYDEIKTIIKEAQEELGYEDDMHWDEYLLTNGQGDSTKSKTLTNEMIAKLDSNEDYMIEFTSYSTHDKPTLIITFRSYKSSYKIGVNVHYPYNE